MNRVALAVIGLGLVMTAVRAWGSEAQAKALLTTDGYAEVSAENDSVRLSLGVVTEGATAEQAAETNAARSKTVLAAVQALKVKGLKLKTSRFQVQPQWDYERKPARISGYTVHSAVEANQEEAEAAKLTVWVPKLIQAALANGANAVDELTFYRRDRDALDQQALTQATAQAMAKAQALARAAGVRLKRVAGLSSQPAETPPGPMPMRAMAFGAAEKQMTPPIEAGESKIAARVTLTYEIE
jgi:uncharacterized protein